MSGMVHRKSRRKLCIWLLKEYCNFDVDILRYGYLELRKQYLKIAIINLFQYMTIAGVYMSIYRSKYL